jgi:processive 1,2-diacylglycerol beta-glucosyltransferase
MKVLLLSVPTGYGHHQTALSVQDCFSKMNIQSHIVDICEYINPTFAKSVSKTYLISTKFVPKTYGKIYRLAETKGKDNYTIAMDIFGVLTAKKFTNYIEEYNPDVIVCTHVFSAQIVTALRQKKLIDKPCIGIVTDFTTHPYWEDSDIDYYVTASDLLNNQMMKKGIGMDKILPYGIPIKEKFSHKISKQEARRRLGIEDKNTILVMTGSMGFGKVVDKIMQIDNLDQDMQLLCVCGFNKKLKAEIESRKWRKKVCCFGFVDNIDLMMDASDCIVTKPGGLTISESLAKGIIPILIDPIPGQEDRNAEFLVNNGIAIKTSEFFPIDEAIYQLILHPERIPKMEEQVRSFGKPHAAKDLCDFIANTY